MNTSALNKLTGAFLIVVPLSFTICFTLLQQLFEYPDILRQPTIDVMTKFRAGGSALIAVWYVLTITALLFVPISVLMHRVLAARSPTTLLWVATTFGVLAGLVQTLGFLRWPFLVPHLAQAYLAPGASEAQRAAAAIVFDAFHIYLGMGVGEHLGYLSTSIWTILIALVMVRTATFPRWFAILGMVFAIGIATGLGEPAGWEQGGTINALSYIGWSIWLMACGGMLIVRRSQVTATVASPVPAFQGATS